MKRPGVSSRFAVGLAWGAAFALLLWYALYWVVAYVFGS
jgi:hypothetical protein